MQSRTDWLERAANAAIIIAAICCIGVWTWFMGVRDETTRPESSRHAVGESLASVEELGPLDQRTMLLVYVSPGCRYCTESMPYYRELLSSRSESVRVVFAAREHVEDLREYMRTHLMPLETTETVRIKPGAAFQHSPTPTVFLLDSQRRISQMWIGKMTEQMLAQVKGTLTGAAGD